VGNAHVRGVLTFLTFLLFPGYDAQSALPLLTVVDSSPSPMGYTRVFLTFLINDAPSVLSLLRRVLSACPKLLFPVSKVTPEESDDCTSLPGFNGVLRGLGGINSRYFSLFLPVSQELSLTSLPLP